jgi:peroxiredoxin
MAISRFLVLLGALIISNPHITLAIPQKGEQAPPFKVTSTTGQHISLDNYRGKVLIMEYFATWCSPCQASVPHLIKISNKFRKQGLQILGMSLDDDGEKAVREFIIANKLNYPVALAGDGVQADYAIRSVPTIYVISKKGLIAEKFMGYNEEIEKRLDLLLLKLLSE